jgi:hypothetical protein
MSVLVLGVNLALLIDNAIFSSLFAIFTICVTTIVTIQKESIKTTIKQYLI